MSKITISFEVDSPAQARDILAAVERIPDTPYSLAQWGSQVLRAQPKTHAALGIEPEADPQQLAMNIQSREVLESVNKAPTPASVERKNVSPGTPLISKIGSNTKEELLKMLLTADMQPHAKYKEHLKLLWSRGEVKFDGTTYYL